MKVTREVVRDLLPLYVAGEASRDSRELVESYLAGDPELRSLAESLRAAELGPAHEFAPPNAARAALERTRSVLRRRSRLLALALFFTGLPLSFVYDSTSGLRFLLLRDAPSLGLSLLVTAVVLWISWGVVAHRLRVTGL